MDWTRRSKRDSQSGLLRTIQYAGNPSCGHPASKGITQQVEGTIIAVSCLQCGREVRYERIPPKVAFPPRPV